MPGKNSTPPFQSKLTPFRKAIQEAWFARKTQKEIQTSLAEKHDIAVALSSLPAFIKHIRRRRDPHDMPTFTESQSPAEQPVAGKKPAKIIKLRFSLFMIFISEAHQMIIGCGPVSCNR